MAQASAENLEHTGPAEMKRVASVSQNEQLARTLEPPLPKGKGTEPSVQIHRSRSQDREAGESQDELEPHLCTNQQPPERGGAVPDPVWVGSK